MGQCMQPTADALMAISALLPSRPALDLLAQCRSLDASRDWSQWLPQWTTMLAELMMEPNGDNNSNDNCPCLIADA